MAMYQVNDVINDINKQYDRAILIIPSEMLADILKNWDDMMFTLLINYLIKNDKMDVLYELVCDMCHYSKMNFLKIIIKKMAKNNMKINYFDTIYISLIAYKWTTELTTLKYLYNLNMIDPNIEIDDGLTRDDYQLVFNINDKLFI
jgi:hypothetical protein